MKSKLLKNKKKKRRIITSKCSENTSHTQRSRGYFYSYRLQRAAPSPLAHLEHIKLPPPHAASQVLCDQLSVCFVQRRLDQRMQQMCARGGYRGSALHARLGQRKVNGLDAKLVLQPAWRVAVLCTARLVDIMCINLID